MILTRKTFKDLTAPGYFDFSSGQTDKTKKMVLWFNSIFETMETNINLFDETFRLWQTKDYSSTTEPVTPFLQKKLDENGTGWFRGSISLIISLLIYFSRSYPVLISRCFQDLFTFLLSINWISESGQVSSSINFPARSSEVLLIFSNSVSAPATPTALPYNPRIWEAPAGWNKVAENATFYSFGYISGTNIVWMTARSTTGIPIVKNVVDIAGLPVSPSVGDSAIVGSDGTGDVNSLYYFDGAVWRKVSTPNENQGSVSEARFDDSSSVFAPEVGFASSFLRPPLDGPSEGFGFYGTYSTFPFSAKRINLVLSLTTEGEQNLGMIVFLLKRIKPSLISLVLFYTTPANPTLTELEIFDIGSIQ